MPALGGEAADELWLFAGRGPGAQGSFWVTDLNVMNVSGDEIEVAISLLPGGGTETFTMEPDATLSLPDVVSSTFGREGALGVLHVEVVEDPDEEAELGEDDAAIVARARIYDRGSVGTVGQSIDGMPSHAAISAGGPAATTHVVGVRNDDSYRTNWLAFSPEDEDNPGVEAVVLLEVLDGDGDVIASKRYTIAPGALILHGVADAAPAFEEGTLRFTMEAGRALVVGSMVDMTTNDPTTVEAHWSADSSEKQFTDQFATEECTFSTTTGEESFFPLIPGLQVVLEGEDDGEIIRNTIEVTGQARMVDGVLTRVVTETELADGELVEKSRNFFARCVETGSIFYFGEEVDIYEDGEIVSHDGAWLAGQNGARPGIIMTGEGLAGSRYYQEVAPGVALDRAEHLLSGLEIETPAGTFDDCTSVRDTSPLDPSGSSFKIYCRGIGIVHDSGTELVSFTVP
jgi:hypothetical protein